jgi:hypothetical protein
MLTRYQGRAVRILTVKRLPRIGPWSNLTNMLGTLSLVHEFLGLVWGRLCSASYNARKLQPGIGYWLQDV